MNLRDERGYQKLLELLDAMELTAENRKKAEQYLDISQPENGNLLKEVEHQDFSALDQEKKKKGAEYVEHCKKRNRTEELGRYVRFMAAVGGSTASYVISYGWNQQAVMEFLTPEQLTAIKAEGLAWNNQYMIRRATTVFEHKDPEIFRRAMELNYRKYDNTKMLLAALSLHYSKPEIVQGGILKNLFSKDKPESKIQNTVKYAEDTLIESIPPLFLGTSPSDEDLKKLQDYVKNAPREASGKIPPFPQELSAILRGKQVSEYLETLLAGSAFLSIEHSGRFAAFLCLTAAMDAEMKRSTTLNICLHIGEKPWFLKHIGALEDSLPIAKEDYVVWCLENQAEPPLTRAIQNYPAVVKQVAIQASTDHYQYLMTRIKKDAPKLYQEMSVSLSGEFRMKMAEEIVSFLSVGKTEARDYLLGDTQLETLYPFVPKWRDGKRYFTNKYLKDQKLKKNEQEQQMFRRTVVLEGLCMNASVFCYYWKGGYGKSGKDEIAEILKIFDAEKLPARYQLEAISAMYDGFYAEKDKTQLINDCVMLFCAKMNEWRDVFVAAAKDSTVIGRFLCIRILDVYWKEYKDVLLSCALDSSKQVRELLTAVYESHKEWEPQIKAMLTSKKSQEREMAALVLKKWGPAAYREELEAALAAEKSQKIKTLLQSCLGMEDTAEEQVGAQTSDELVQNILKGGKKRKIAWVSETPFMEVHKADSTLASEDYLAALLVAYADMGTPGVSKDAARLAEDLDKKDLALYMGMLFNRWLETGAEAKKKWVLYAVSIHGGDEIIPALHAQIQEWPKAARGAMAAEAVRALALNGSATALLLVDQIARKFKFRQVKTAASDALSYAAEQLGISKAELEDRIVPNLGFDEKMEQIFDYGNRKFRVILSPTLELEIFDEGGKKIKNLPAPGKNDEPEKSKAASDAFKLLKKQLKTVVTNQKLRLEQALSTERLWQVEQWKELFVKNPVMHQFAMGLIWGLYDNGVLKDTFRYMEDGSFNTVEEEEYELPETGTIGLVHPIELDDENLAAWKEQLSDYEVTQPVEQLERPIYRTDEKERSQTELTRFGGKLLNGLSLSGKLQNQGWYRGSVEDAGVYSTFYREDDGIGVELEFSGCYVGDENEEVTVYGAKFYKAGTVKRGSYVYDTIKKENLHKLSEISPRYFSEIVLQLTKATASSKEQLPYPACKENQ